MELLPDQTICWRQGQALDLLEIINSQPGNPFGIAVQAHVVLKIDAQGRAFD
jgi:hypothetical protein